MDLLTKHSTANNPVLKIVVGVLFILFPIIAFILGLQFQVLNNQTVNEVVVSPVPTKYEVSTTSPTPVTVDETANWKTYISSKFNFQLKYPNNWFVKDVIRQNLDDELWFSDLGIFPGTETVGNGAQSPIRIIFSEKDLSTELRPESFSNFKDEVYLIGNVKGRKISGFHKESLSNFIIITGYIGNIYINIYPINTDDYILITNQILSTFKFTQ